MIVYKISQNVNQGYDSWDAAIVVAESEDDARLIHPKGLHVVWKEFWDFRREERIFGWVDTGEWSDEDCQRDSAWVDEVYGKWAPPVVVKVEKICDSLAYISRCVLLASWNAG